MMITETEVRKFVPRTAHPTSALNIFLCYFREDFYLVEVLLYCFRFEFWGAFNMSASRTGACYGFVDTNTRNWILRNASSAQWCVYLVRGWQFEFAWVTSGGELDEGN
jgi:hypothetical protein